jgi:pimeloyl-ACP methyl ester carboxylesterase
MLAGFVATSAGRAAPGPPTEEGMIPYLAPQRLVDVEKGRALNLVCLGEGSPTVILSAGLSGWSYAWWLVQPALAQRTRVCAWDRAGYGFSSPSAQQQDIVHTTGDLERALGEAGIQGPYVMVGHSFGGYESLRFADLHRQSVVGMVLVDPDIPDRSAVDERVAPQFAALSLIFQQQSVKRLRDCAAGLRAGTLERDTPPFAQCTASPVPDFFPRLKAAIARLNADPARLLTQASLENEHATGNSGREVINARRHYGDMPLIVLTAGRDEQSALSSLSHLPPDTPGAGTPAELARLREDVARFIRDGWVPAHEAYAALSTRGRHELVPESGHNIMVDKPAVVISAIVEVVEASLPVP